MSDDKPQIPGTIDDIVSENGISLDDSFNYYQTFRKQQKHHLDQVLIPSVKKFYDSFKASLRKKDIETDTTIKGKRDDIRDALSDAIEGYLRVASPKTLKAIEDQEEKEGKPLSGEKRFDYLAHHYDELIGAGKVQGVDSIRALLNAAENADDKMKAADLTNTYWDMSRDHVKGMNAIIENKKKLQYFGHHSEQNIASHIKEKMLGKSYEVNDHTKFHMLEKNDLVSLGYALKTDEWGDKNAKHYHLKKLEPK